MKRRALVSALALGVLACGDSPPASSPSPLGGAPAANGGAGAAAGSPACGAGPAAPAGVLAKQVPVFGKTRKYTLVVPPAYSPSTSLPLVFVLHGNGGSGMQARASFDLEPLAQGRALFAYPDAIGGGWDLDSAASKNPDVAFFDAILAVTQSAYCVDLRRVFVVGFSNGAYMANQLGCRRGDRIRGVATLSGGGPYEVAGEYDEQGHLVCRGKPVASLVIHGTADTVVSPSEGQKSIDHWSFANHCGGSAAAAPSCIAFQGCANPVSACKVAGLGHGIAPQTKPLVWSFLDALR